MANFFWQSSSSSRSRTRSNNHRDDGNGNNQDDVATTETATADAAAAVAAARPFSNLPLSMQLMKAVSGLGGGGGGRSGSIYCAQCRSAHSNNNENDDDANFLDEINAATICLQTYDLQALRRQNSSASPLVMAPMMAPSARPTTTTSSSSVAGGGGSSGGGTVVTVEQILTEYMAACRFYNCDYNAGALTTLRFSLPCMRLSASFHDADMLALAEILLHYANGPLQFIQRLDFSIPSKQGLLHGKAGFRSHGALALAKVLQTTAYIKEIYIQRNLIGPYGASALFIACSNNPSIEKLVLRRCRIGERGAFLFAELMENSSECGLKDVDLSANNIGFRGTLAIEEALGQRQTVHKLHPITVDLEGNLVFQEIMNGVTHALGSLLAVLGAYLLSKKVEDLSPQHVTSCAVYSTSLMVLYISSTLYHSFFTMRNTKWIFEVVDKCAIYIVISGTYTPFLMVVLYQEALLSMGLFCFQWICCFCGILVEAMLPAWRFRTTFSLIMYLGMGWSALVCLPNVARVLPREAMDLMILGGVAYTAGVPFFVRNNNLDHSIWHCFVLAGSIFHWFAIYFYVTQVPIIHSVGS